jgi:hypothetical protein
MERVKKMKGLSGFFSVLFILLHVGSPYSFSQEAQPTPAALPSNSFLMPKLEEIIKTAMRVVREDEGVVSLTLPGMHSYAAGTPILFFRKKSSRLEMIATGKALNEETDRRTGKLLLQVELDKDTVIKYPVEGDFAAPLSDPNALAEGEKRDQNDFLIPDEDPTKKINDRAGYLQVGAGLIYGQLGTTTSTVANNSKATSAYRFQNLHFSYFSDFFPIGVTFDSHSGNFPTSTFYSDVVSSKEAVSLVGFYYRFSPLLEKKLEISAKFSSLSDRFTTDNTDENLLTTQVSGMGGGIRARYDFAPLLWRAPKGRWIDLTFQALTADFSYFPLMTVSDLGVSRGSDSSKSSGIQLRASATFLIWLDFIPLVKRWVFEGSYGFRSYSLQFSGPTVPESVAAPVPIPEGTRATEREGDFRFFFGFRIDDPIRSLFSQGKKK